MINREQNFRMYLLALAIILGIAVLFIAFDKAFAQETDPILSDARYYEQAKQAILQEQRGNALQIQLLQKRQEEIKQIIPVLDQKSKN